MTEAVAWTDKRGSVSAHGGAWWPLSVELGKIEGRTESLLVSRLGCAVSALDDVDYVAGVLSRGGCGHVANPSHELHDVFEDVRFGDLTMCPRQHAEERAFALPSR